MRHHVSVTEIEFDEGGHTLWVQSAGCTVLRIKTMNGQIKIQNGCDNPVPHADITTMGDIVVCMSANT